MPTVSRPGAPRSAAAARAPRPGGQEPGTCSPVERWPRPSPDALRRPASMACGVERIEDDGEPELELVTEVVARLQVVLRRHVLHVRVRTGREPLDDRLGHV